MTLECSIYKYTVQAASRGEKETLITFKRGKRGRLFFLLKNTSQLYIFSFGFLNGETTNFEGIKGFSLAAEGKEGGIGVNEFPLSNPPF